MTQTRGSQRRGERKIWPALLLVPVLLVTVLTAGLALPLPYVDIAAALLSGLFVYMLPAALVLAVLALLVWRARHTGWRLALFVLAAASAAGWTIVTVQSLAFASREGVSLDWGQLFAGFSVPNRGPDETLVYTRYAGKDVTLSIWRPKGVSVGAPVLVMTHGGGFAGGSVTEQILPYARWLANEGYLVIGANYTLSDKKVHAWNIAEDQIACALAWANEHAASYGGDVSRLGMYGESAGGNLVINSSYKIAAGKLRSPCGGSLPRVRAVSTIYPVVGIIESYDNDHMLGKIGRQFDEQYLGGTPKQFPERYAAVQSANSVSAAAPPTLMVYGAVDHLVPPGGTRSFTAAAQKAGVTIRAIEVPHGEHGYDLVSGGVGAQVWRKTTLDWFGEYLAVDGIQARPR